MIIKGTSHEERAQKLRQMRRRVLFALMLSFVPIFLILVVVGIDAGVKYFTKGNKQSAPSPYPRLKAGTPRIERAPGSVFLIFVDFFYSSKTVENIFLPLVADWRNEYFEALLKGRKWKARWISIRYRYIFIQVIGSEIVSVIIKILKGLK
jgi:hypothetical protein